MMEAVKAELVELGVPHERIETEAFGPAEGMVPHDALETDLVEVKGVAAAQTGQCGGRRRASALLRLEKDRALAAPISRCSKPLKRSASRLTTPAGSGTCGVCRVRLLEGAVAMQVEEGLQPGDKDAASSSPARPSRPAISWLRRDHGGEFAPTMGYADRSRYRE